MASGTSDEHPIVPASGPLSAAVSPSSSSDRERDRAARSTEGPTTASLQKLPEAVPVLIVASSFALAYRLEAALGPTHVATETVDDLRRLRVAVRELRPRVVVVDAIDAPALEPALLAEDIALPGVVCVVWGREMAYAKRVHDALDALEALGVSIARKDGIEPVVDLVRSLRAD